LLRIIVVPLLILRAAPQVTNRFGDIARQPGPALPKTFSGKEKKDLILEERGHRLGHLRLGRRWRRRHFPSYRPHSRPSCNASALTALPLTMVRATSRKAPAKPASQEPVKHGPPASAISIMTAISTCRSPVTRTTDSLESGKWKIRVGDEKCGLPATGMRRGSGCSFSGLRPGWFPGHHPR
jgi:hypothetical protein